MVRSADRRGAHRAELREQPTGEGSLTFVFDENLPARIARAIGAVRDSACHVCDVGLRGKPDAEQLLYTASRGAIFVTSDKRIKNREHERAALLASGVSVVEVSFPDAYSLWNRFKMVVNHWESTEALLDAAEGQAYVVMRPRSVHTLAEDERRSRRRRR